MNKRLVGLMAGVLATGCVGEWKTGGNIGGANRNARHPGNIAGGIAVRAGDIAVSPAGNYFVTLKGGSVVQGTVGSEDAKVVNGLPKPDLLAFWGQGEGFYVLSKERSGLTRAETGKQILVSYDRAAGQEKWRLELNRDDKRLDVTQNRVIITGQRLTILDAQDGHVVADRESTTGFRDVDVIHGGSQILATEETSWEDGSPATTLSVVNTEDGSEESTTDAPNCADDVEVSEDESTAYLAPTLCQQDPVTVLALETSGIKVVKNMPGFGPVARSPNGGHTVVAFLDRDAAPPEGTVVPDAVLNARERYHLMLIDTNTLEYTTSPVGNSLPRYAFTQDGKNLLVDTPMETLSNIRIFDMAQKTMRAVSGPNVKLNLFTLSGDGGKAFIAENQLFVLDVGAARVRSGGFSIPPASVNLSLDGLTLLVSQSTDRMMLFLDALNVRETGRVAY